MKLFTDSKIEDSLFTVRIALVDDCYVAHVYLAGDRIAESLRHRTVAAAVEGAFASAMELEGAAES